MPSSNSLTSPPNNINSTEQDEDKQKHHQNPSLDDDHPHQYLDSLLDSTRPFLRGELGSVDPNLPRLVSVLQEAGAGECWHKHGSFLDHLIGVYRILKIWGAPDPVCLCGLFHSAYSNSYVNLAIFPPSSSGRDLVRSHVGPEAERLIHLFCIVPRQPLIHDLLLFKYTDDELLRHLNDPSDAWRVKLQTLLPPEGIVVKHIKTGEDILVTRRVAAIFILMTMADFSDQLFGFQDSLFENKDGRLEFSGDNVRNTLWPGDGKPGLWMNSNSRMAVIYMLIVREEELWIKENGPSQGRDEELELVVPPVFERCTRVLDAGDQIEARDLYWEAVCGDVEKAEEKLLRSIEKNPYVGEARVVLGQVYLSAGRFEAAEEAAGRGLKLLLEWGSPWDKRMTWQGWVAWARVLLMKAREKSWPQDPWGILNLGLVR